MEPCQLQFQCLPSPVAALVLGLNAPRANQQEHQEMGGQDVTGAGSHWAHWADIPSEPSAGFPTGAPPTWVGGMLFADQKGSGMSWLNKLKMVTAGLFRAFTPFKCVVTLQERDIACSHYHLLIMGLF